MRLLATACLITLMQAGTLTAQAQDRGTLTVTATVVTSVAVVTDGNGQPRIVVANPSDRNDNVSYLSYAPAISAANTEHLKKSDSATTRRIAKPNRATLQ